MKKASKVLFLIGGIVGILVAIVFLALGIVYLSVGVLATSADVPEWAQKIINEIIAQNPGYTIAQVASVLKTTGAVLIVFFVVAVAAVVLSFICSSKENRPLALLIVATAFAAAGGTVFSILGGIFGIINWAQERKKQTPAA